MDITITVPLTEKDLRGAAKQLLEMAEGRMILLPDLNGPALRKDTTLSAETPTPPAVEAAILPTIPPPPSAIHTGPVATPPPPLAPASIPAVIELDTEGLPWDERIHSGAKTKYAKDNPQTNTVGGSWKRKRGVHPLTVDQVKAELLRLIYPAPVAPVAPTPPAAPAATTAPAAVSPVNSPYLTLMQKCTERIAALEIAIEDIVAICNRHGLNKIKDLAERLDLIPTIEAEIEELWIRNTQR